MERTYRIYGHKTEPGQTPDGATLEWYYGCCGDLHAAVLHKLWFEADGTTVSYAEEVLVLEQGACDGTCNPADLGWFLHPCEWPPREPQEPVPNDDLDEAVEGREHDYSWQQPGWSPSGG